MQRKIAVLVGSLRRESLNRKMAEALCGLAPEGLAFEFMDIGSLPLYNEDLEADAPQAWTKLRESLRTCDGFLFVTPEYNRSVPAALKNALDVGSRPYGQSVWNGKPGAVLSLSPGAIGGFGANHHLRQSLTCLNVFVLQQPEAYVGGASGFFGADGKLADTGVREFATKFMSAFGRWLERNAARTSK